MSERLEFTILGCGSSPGVPRVNGDWGACDPSQPRNRRRRAAALVRRYGADGVTTVAIDCGPDFRNQMLDAEVRHLDAVVLTHPHADHIHGIDDVRGFAQDRRGLVPVYADKPTFARVFEAFGYCFRTPKGSDYPPIVEHVPIWAGQPFAIEGAGGPITLRPFHQVHGRILSLGFRIGDVAYCSDVSDFPAPAIDEISGAPLLIIDALQRRPHPSHLSLDEALQWIGRLEVGQAVLTHMHTPLDYDTLCAELPPHVRPAYDGQTFAFPIR